MHPALFTIIQSDMTNQRDVDHTHKHIHDLSLIKQSKLINSDNINNREQTKKKQNKSIKQQLCIYT